MIRTNIFSAFRKKYVWHIFFCACLNILVLPTQSVAATYVEYQVKSAFIYNFLAYTRWPEGLGKSLSLCMYGEHKFGEQINNLQGRHVNKYHITVAQVEDVEALKECQAIFFSESVKNNLPEILSHLQEQPILTMADSESATSKGIMINMGLINEKIVFDINLAVAKNVGLNISSKLLKLAQQVYN